MKIHAILATLLLHLGLPALAQPDEAGKLIAAGTVPDEAARAAILGKLRELYGAANVVDRLEVGGVVPPPNWADNVTRVFAWFGGEHASYDPQPSGLPDSVQPAGATAGRRNTFRTPPAPWDSGVYVTPRLDADDGEVRR